MNTAFWALALAAASVGALHSVAPDHWVPFAALARARRWSAWRTARITLACGLGYLDFRFAGHWRKDHPRLVAWLDAFAARVPAFNATKPPPS